MLSKAAARLSVGLARRGIIHEEDIEVYAYGLELVLSSAISTLLVIVVSLLFLKPLAWLFFLLSFIPIRLTAGGYHAKSHLQCFIVFTIAYAFFMAGAVLGAALVTPIILIGISAISVLIILLLAPLQSESKPMSGEELHRNRRRSVLISLAFLVVTAIGFLTGPWLMWALTLFALGQLGAALSLLAAKVIRH